MGLFGKISGPGGGPGGGGPEGTNGGNGGGGSSTFGLAAKTVGLNGGKFNMMSFCAMACSG